MRRNRLTATTSDARQHAFIERVLIRHLGRARTCASSCSTSRERTARPVHTPSGPGPAHTGVTELQRGRKCGDGRNRPTRPRQEPVDDLASMLAAAAAPRTSRLDTGCALRISPQLIRRRVSQMRHRGAGDDCTRTPVSASTPRRRRLEQDAALHVGTGEAGLLRLAGEALKHELQPQVPARRRFAAALEGGKRIGGARPGQFPESECSPFRRALMDLVDDHACTCAARALRVAHCAACVVVR